MHLRPFLMTQVKLIGKGYKRATNSHYRESSKNDQEQGIHIQMELVLVKSEAIFVRIPLSTSGSPMMNKDFPNRSSYSGLVAQGPLLAFTAVPQQLNWKCSSQTVIVNRKGSNELTSFSPFALFLLKSSLHCRVEDDTRFSHLEFNFSLSKAHASFSIVHFHQSSKF